MRDWAIMPVLDCWDYTREALGDLLAQQGVEIRVLVINQGSTDGSREKLEAWAEREPRLLIWTHDPPLLSLSATWNLALRFVWAVGGAHALVVNNDVRLRKETYATLRLIAHNRKVWFISGVGVAEEQYDPMAPLDLSLTGSDGEAATLSKGGPDFSCFLLTKEGHEQYPLDERFQPAYCEDVDLHRRYLLGGDGARIFGVNVPFLHYGSRTINRSPEEAERFSRLYAACVERYAAKWGGRPNEETYRVPDDPTSAEGGITTPDLQRQEREA